MTNEEAIKQLEELIDDRKSFCKGVEYGDDAIYLGDIEALKRAVTALDIRTPKAPVKDIAGKTVCPNCRSLQRPRTDTISYCVWCGQAIKWR